MDEARSRIPFHERITCTIPDACAATGLGRTLLYEKIGAGLVQSTKVKGRRVVLVASLKALVGGTQ